MKALKDKVQSIFKADVEQTVRHFCHSAGLSTGSQHVRLIGSAGKTIISRDIDLAVSTNVYNSETIHGRLVDFLGKDLCVLNRGTKIGSYATPIVGAFPPGKVQVDIMYVGNLDWAEFIYYSPGDESKYRGSVRAVLLGAVAASICDVSRDFFSYDNSELIARAGWTIDPNVGMKRIFQIRFNKIHDSGYVKQMKNITPEELQELYPHNTFDHQQYVISDPRRVTELLFGWGTIPNHIDTTEKIIELIKKRHTVAWHENFLFTTSEHIFR
ncbi:hypothetical protein LCGC14_1458480, partial [marine sediment metagenome]